MSETERNKETATTASPAPRTRGRLTPLRAGGGGSSVPGRTGQCHPESDRSSGVFSPRTLSRVSLDDAEPRRESNANLFIFANETGVEVGILTTLGIVLYQPTDLIIYRERGCSWPPRVHYLSLSHA